MTDRTRDINGLAVIAGMVALLLGACSSAPPVIGGAGEPVPGSLATLEAVALNGSRQWITVRSTDASNPILLFLAGGPGGSELPSTRLHLRELEEMFTVVNWNQAGAAKSFRSVRIGELTPDRYVEDGLALIDHLLERFDQEKVYLLGESWESMLGVWLSQAASEKIAAFVGSGQMVTFTENDIMGYEFAIDYLEGRGDYTAARRASGTTSSATRCRLRNTLCETESTGYGGSFGCSTRSTRSLLAWTFATMRGHWEFQST